MLTIIDSRHDNRPDIIPTSKSTVVSENIFDLCFWLNILYGYNTILFLRLIETVQKHEGTQCCQGRLKEGVSLYPVYLSINLFSRASYSLHSNESLGSPPKTPEISSPLREDAKKSHFLSCKLKKNSAMKKNLRKVSKSSVMIWNVRKENSNKYNSHWEMMFFIYIHMNYYAGPRD